MPNTDQKNQSPHQPVLLAEVLAALNPQKGESYLDLTAGYGGHADKVLQRTLNPDEAILVDRDKEAVDYLTANMPGRIRIIHSDFLNATSQLVQEGRQFDLILADLGASSPHFDIAERGFSFSSPGPLDMRMDQEQEVTAEKLVNNLGKEELEQVLRQYGQEPKARAIAAKIIANRPISDTKRLAEIVADAKGGRRNAKIHPATLTFQAIRLAVNEELYQLEQSLPLMVELLKPGGKLAIISFHSLEDRIVKNFFAENGADTYDAQLELITKKPISASPDEIVLNPRARSAKLRAAAKIKTKRKDRE